MCSVSMSVVTISMMNLFVLKISLISAVIGIVRMVMTIIMGRRVVPPTACVV